MVPLLGSQWEAGTEVLRSAGPSPSGHPPERLGFPSRAPSMGGGGEDPKMGRAARWVVDCQV